MSDSALGTSPLILTVRTNRIYANFDFILTTTAAAKLVPVQLAKRHVVTTLCLLMWPRVYKLVSLLS
jgi:hypothetical protein